MIYIFHLKARIIKKEKLFSNSFSACKMSLKVSQNFAVIVPEKCHLSQKKSLKVPEWPQKNMACMPHFKVRCQGHE